MRRHMLLVLRGLSRNQFDQLARHGIHQLDTLDTTDLDNPWRNDNRHTRPHPASHGWQQTIEQQGKTCKPYRQVPE
ncbi:hypothetical protein UNDYM_3433 [Undibacterium sp. YM2]|nr:hypothetical protein UNDYM_3433 [Undibacterium sp. YM2]